MKKCAPFSQCASTFALGEPCHQIGSLLNARGLGDREAHLAQVSLQTVSAPVLASAIDQKQEKRSHGELIKNLFCPGGGNFDPGLTEAVVRCTSTDERYVACFALVDVSWDYLRACH